MRLLLLLIISPVLINAQTYTGRVIDKKTKAAIPFATIGLIKENTGINADEKGKFIVVSKIPHDSLIISCVGYETKKLPIADLKEMFVELNERITNLREIIIVNKKKWKSTTL